MKKDQHPSIPKHFANITDPRRYNSRHKLIDIITIAICAVICNADGFEHISEFGQAKYDWFKNFLELPHGIPSADTFERVFARIDPKEFKTCFMETRAIYTIISNRIFKIGSKMVLKTYRSIIMKPLTPNMEKLKSVDIGRYRI